MDRIQRPLTLIACILLASCDLVETTPCTTELRFGLNVTVVSAADGTPVIEGLEVTARDEPYFEVLVGVDNQRQGAPERAGIYTLNVSAPGFVGRTVNGVEVRRGQCHVTPAVVTVELAPVVA